MRVTVLSGKGGTGKTTVAVALALSLPNAQLLDCDVEAPNAHLFLDLETLGREEVSALVPAVDPEVCDGCRDLSVPRCREACEFGAIAVVKGRVLTFPELCHGCAACITLCPRGALSEARKLVGTVEEALAGGLRVVTGRLEVGEPRPVDIIRAVKRRIDPDRDAVLDASPGVACPVVTTLEGSDAAILVTEPTPFGLHDLRLAVDLCRQLSIPAGVVLNRADIGDEKVEEYVRAEGLPLLLRIPHDRGIAAATARGEPLVRARPEYVPRFRRLLEDLSYVAAGMAVLR